MAGFTIVHPLVNLEIRLEEINKLHIHEEIISGYLHKLVKTILSDQCLMHPIIVDKQNYVVLDGMHRIAATQQIGCHYIPVCLLEYTSPHVVVGCWYRTLTPISEVNRITPAIEALGYFLKKTPIGYARRLVEKREAIAAIAFNSICYSIHGFRGDIHGIYDAIRRIEYKLRSEGFSIIYETEQDAIKKVTTGEYYSMLMVPTVSKKEVIKAALSRSLLYHKTTRHVIPMRPMFVNIPLEWLYQVTDSDQINQKLVKYLSKKTLTRLPPGQILDRRYDEELYVFG